MVGPVSKIVSGKGQHYSLCILDFNLDSVVTDILVYNLEHTNTILSTVDIPSASFTLTGEYLENYEQEIFYEEFNQKIIFISLSSTMIFMYLFSHFYSFFHGQHHKF